MSAVQPVLAQSTLLQGGPWKPGHAPMYAGPGSSQAVVQDSGGAGGGGAGVGLSELGITARGTGAAPYAGVGTGPFGTNICDYDGPITSAAGYHFLCLSANAQGGGLLAYGAGGVATPLPFSININGIGYQFPFAISGIVGPSPTTVGQVPFFNNTLGTLLGASSSFSWDQTNNQLMLGLTNPVIGCGVNSGNLKIGPDWTTDPTYFPNFGGTSLMACYKFGAAADSGHGAVSAYVRTKDYPTGASGEAIQSFAFADNTSERHGAWPIYTEGHKMSPNDYAYGLGEAAVVNRINSICTIDPYGPVGDCNGTVGLQIDSGDSFPTSAFTYYTASVGLIIINNSDASQVNNHGFECGVCIINGGIDTTLHTPGWGVAMAQNQGVVWFAGNNTLPQWKIFSSGNTAAAGGSIEMKNSALTIYPNSGQDAVNFFSVTNAAKNTFLLSVDTANSRVGIGSNTPAYTLDVVGDVNASGIFRKGGVAGVTCSGSPTSSFASSGGIVTHC